MNSLTALQISTNGVSVVLSPVDASKYIYGVTFHHTRPQIGQNVYFGCTFVQVPVTHMWFSVGVSKIRIGKPVCYRIVFSRHSLAFPWSPGTPPVVGSQGSRISFTEKYASGLAYFSGPGKSLQLTVPRFMWKTVIFTKWLACKN